MHGATEEIFALCERLDTEALCELSKMIEAKAKEKKEDEAKSAFADFVNAWKRYRTYKPTEICLVEVQVECDDCENTIFPDVDIFEMLDDMLCNTKAQSPR